MDVFKKLSEIRREYGDLSLSEDNVDSNPITQFELWFQEVLQYEKNDPTAMVLSTVDPKGLPDSRIVLLKSLSEEGHFIFYTNYHSAKAKQLQAKPYAALNFFWPEMARQVRIRGRIEPVSAQESDSYFASRPIKSQLSAILSHQSQEIQSRSVLENALEDLIQKQNKNSVVRPSYWGGYRLIPEEIEFWQGRNDRLHDRIHYYQQKGAWVYHRLAP